MSTHQIVGLAVKGKAKIDVAEVPLHHRKLGEVSASFGEAELRGEDALIVVTEDESGGKATVRFSGTAEDMPLDLASDLQDEAGETTDEGYQQ